MTQPSQAAVSLKPQYGWSVVMYLPITPAVGNGFIRLCVSANAVSWLSLMVFACGLAVYLNTNDQFSARLLIAILFSVGTLFDVVDGYVARATNKTGKKGAMLDAAIDLVRYNLFFVAVYFKRSPGPLEVLMLSLYALLITISLSLTFNRARVGAAAKKMANRYFGQILPRAYTEFCDNHRLLYNPLNIEDQLNLGIFLVGIISGQELLAIIVCLFIRAAEAGLTLLNLAKTRLKS